MKQTADGHQYIALGVSNDDRMGNDLTFICKHGIPSNRNIGTHFPTNQWFENFCQMLQNKFKVEKNCGGDVQESM